MPQKMNNPDEYSAEFLDINQEAINELATFAQIYQGFTLAFAEVNFALDVQVLLKVLKNHPRCQDVHFVVIEITDPELEFVLLELKEGLQQATLEPDKKIVIVVLGLERAIGFVETEKTPEVLENLNFARNVFTEQLPYPIIFVLPDYAVTRLARGARDFWAWASAVIAFRSGRQTIEQVHRQVLEPKRSFSSDAKPVKQERIDTLLRLLTQYQPTLGKPDAEVAPLRLNILEELANAYLSLCDGQKAEHFFTEALSLAQSLGNQWTQANALFGLGRTLALLGSHYEALKHYEQVLGLFKVLDDRLNEANTLHEIGDMLQLLRRSQEALNRYDEALKLYKVIGNTLGEANNLHSVGEVFQFLGQPQEALNRYDKALKIYKNIDDSLGEANTLESIGEVFQFLGQPQEALNRYDEALKLYKAIGNTLGEANTLREIGNVLQFLDQPQEALNRYHEALKLYKVIGNALGEANTLKAIAIQILQTKNLDEATFRQAADYVESAYKLYCEIGDQYSQALILLSLGVSLCLYLEQRAEAESILAFAAQIAQKIGSESLQEYAAQVRKSIAQEQT
jgi:tetratricopeptide (TPR) repeat protein